MQLVHNLIARSFNWTLDAIRKNHHIFMENIWHIFGRYNAERVTLHQISVVVLDNVIIRKTQQPAANEMPLISESKWYLCATRGDVSGPHFGNIRLGISQNLVHKLKRPLACTNWDSLSSETCPQALQLLLYILWWTSSLDYVITADDFISQSTIRDTNINLVLLPAISINGPGNSLSVHILCCIFN